MNDERFIFWSGRMYSTIEIRSMLFHQFHFANYSQILTVFVARIMKFVKLNVESMSFGLNENVIKAKKTTFKEPQCV